MEEFLALSYIFKVSTELAKEPALFYQLGYLFGYRGEELILLLLYSRFNYKLAFYFYFDVKIFLSFIFSYFCYTSSPTYAYSWYGQLLL